MKIRRVRIATRWESHQTSFLTNLLIQMRFGLAIPPTTPLFCAFTRAMMIFFAVYCCLLVPSKSAAFDIGQSLKNATKFIEDKITNKTSEKAQEVERQIEKRIDQTPDQSQKAPTSESTQQKSATHRGSSTKQQVSGAGELVRAGEWVNVELPNGMDSTRLKVNDTVNGFLWASKKTPVVLRVIRLNSRVSSGGFADVEVSMESVDNQGQRQATPNTVARIVTDEKDLVKAEGNSAATQEVAAAREVDELFGTGQKEAVRIPAGTRLNFSIGKTESYASPQVQSRRPSRLSPWNAPKSGPQK